MRIKKYKVFTLLALALLVTSLLLVNMNGPASALDPQPIHLHGPPLRPIHMHSNITLKPIHMHSLQGILSASQMVEPNCTDWQELYPNFADMWHLSSWEDTQLPGDPGYGELSPNDQIDMTNLDTDEVEWFHVDRITMTMRLFSDALGEEIYVEYKGPYEPFIQPVCTFWTEVWPVYGGVTGFPYHIIDWGDNGNGYLDFCDFVMFEAWPGIWWHVQDYATDIILRWKMMDPIGSWWHELYPEYSKWYNLTSWEDTGEPFEVPSPGDQIDMTEEESETEIWYHIDRITITINVTSDIDPTRWMMLELKTQYFEEMFYYLKHPIDSLWHEVYPDYSNVYSLTVWDPIDPFFDNCNGVLDPCDYIVLLNMTSPFPVEEMYHIVDMSYDIILNEKITNPVCTDWHELYPECCVNDYHIDDWEDNGDKLLSPCDNITMTLIAGVSTDFYHVEEVTLTLNLTVMDAMIGPFLPGDRIYVEFLGGYEWMYYAKIDPLFTDWEVVCPADYFEMPLTIEYWEDDCNGILSYCDNIELLGIEVDIWCHIDEVALDMVVKEQPVHDVAVIDVFSLYPQVDQGDIDPINVTVENQGDFNETVDVYAFYDGNLAAPKQTIPLNPGQNVTLTFNWNTTGVPLGSYTISANATIPIDDDPLDNYLSDDTQEVIPEFATAIILPLFMILSLIVVVFKSKKKKQ